MLSKQKKIALIYGVVAVVVIGGTVLGFVMLKSNPKPPEVTPGNATNVVKFIASDNFAKLDDAKKKEYLDKMQANPEMRDAMWSQRDNLSEQERQNLRKNMGNAFRQQMKDRMNKYFALKTKEEKNKMLDEMIDEMQKRRAEMEKRRKEHEGAQGNDKPQGPPPGAPGGPGGGSRESHMKGMMESHSPQERAQFMQLMSDMMARAKERGISMPGPGGPRH